MPAGTYPLNDGISLPSALAMVRALAEDAAWLPQCCQAMGTVARSRSSTTAGSCTSVPAQFPVIAPSVTGWQPNPLSWPRKYSLAPVNVRDGQIEIEILCRKTVFSLSTLCVNTELACTERGPGCSRHAELNWKAVRHVNARRIPRCSPCQ